ncbi:hypothetical protein [Brevibacillus formosus]|uniref:hypothetical protein n=1 Tax=Brevibacillus formosus TaxID=54913 RepID=UPI003F1CCF03
MKNESQPYTDYGEMYRDIDLAAEAYYNEFFHAYKTDGRFPEGIYARANEKSF